MVRRFAAWVLGASCLAASAPALAAMQGGPVARLRLEGRYDENVFEDIGGTASSLVQPTVGWRLRDPTTEIDATYTADLVNYASNADAGGVNHRLRGNQQFELDRRTVLSLREGFERVYDPTSLSRPGVVRAAGETNYGLGQVDLQHRITPRLYGAVAYRGEISVIDGVEGLDDSALDGAVHAPSGLLSYGFTRRDTGELRYRFQLFDSFDGVDGASHEPSLGYARLLTRTTRLELEAGPAIYTEEGQSKVVPRGRAAIVHRRPRLVFSAGYERGLVGATGFDGALWSDSIAGSATWRISEPLRGTAAAGWFRNGRAPDDAAFVSGFGGELALEYALTHEFTAEVAWRRVGQFNLVDGSDEAVDLSRNIFAIGVGWQFDGGRPPR